jgi:hypothetical protein
LVKLNFTVLLRLQIPFVEIHYTSRSFDCSSAGLNVWEMELEKHFMQSNSTNTTITIAFKQLFTDQNAWFIFFWRVIRYHPWTCLVIGEMWFVDEFNRWWNQKRAKTIRCPCAVLDLLQFRGRFKSNQCKWLVIRQTENTRCPFMIQSTLISTGRNNQLQIGYQSLPWVIHETESRTDQANKQLYGETH